MSGYDEIEGRVGTPFTMPIELGKVREFARAVGMALDDEEAPTVPPTFLQTAMLWDVPGSSPVYDAGLDFERVLHGEQEFVFHGAPPRAGDALTVQRRVDKVYDKAGSRGGTMTFVEEAVEYRDEAGVIRAEARNTRIITSRPAGQEASS
jgi:N-terminal half of MaoC dehydratase